MLPSRKPVLRTPVLRRQPAYRIAGGAMNEANAESKTEAKAEAAKAEAGAKWSSTGASVGGRGLGPSQARCAPLVRLLLLLRPRFLVQRHRESPKAVPWAFSAHGGAAGHEQRGVEQHGSPRGQPRVGAVGCQVRPSGAAAAPTPTPVLGAAAPGIT